MPPAIESYVVFRPARPLCRQKDFDKKHFTFTKGLRIIYYAFGPVAQLGAHHIRIDMDAHPSASVGLKFWRKMPPQIVKTQNIKNPLFVLKNGQKAVIWARSSAGRAPGSQRYGRTSTNDGWPKISERNSSETHENSKLQKSAFCSEKRAKSGNMGPELSWESVRFASERFGSSILLGSTKMKNHRQIWR